MGNYCVTFDEDKVCKNWLTVFKAMRLTRKEVKELFIIFERLDTKKVGGINLEQWLSLLELPQSSFLRRTFCAFDQNDDHGIDFYEFVVSCWKLATLNEEALSVFAFDLYDNDAKGVLKKNELEQMFRELLSARQLGTKTAQKWIRDLTESNASGCVSMSEFRMFCQHHKIVLTPVHTLQANLREHILGDAFWNAFARRRIYVRKGYYAPISSVITLHADRALFKQLMEDKSIFSGISGLKKVVLENTDSSLHHRTPEHSYNTNDISNNNDSNKNSDSNNPPSPNPSFAISKSAKFILFKPVSTKRHYTGKKKKLPNTVVPAECAYTEYDLKHF